VRNRVQVVGVLAALCLLVGVTDRADAAWRWTPEIGRFIRVKRLLAATPEEQLAMGRKLYDAGKYGEAIAAYRRFFDYFPDSPLADQAQFGIAESYEARGDLADASEEYQKLVVNYRDSTLYDRVVRKQYEIAERFYQNYANRKGLGRLTAGRHLRRAIEVYEQVIENDPFGAGTAEAQYRLAECYFVSDRLEEAKLEYKQVLDQFPASRWARDARFYLALCEYRQMLPARYDQENAQNALNGFSSFLASSPDDERADEARDYVQEVTERLAEHDYLVARFYERRGWPRAALVCYQTLIQEYPETSCADKVQASINRIVEQMTRAGTRGGQTVQQ